MVKPALCPYLVSPNLGNGSCISPIIMAARIKADNFRSALLKLRHNLLVQQYFDLSQYCYLTVFQSQTLRPHGIYLRQILIDHSIDINHHQPKKLSSEGMILLSMKTLAAKKRYFNDLFKLLPNLTEPNFPESSLTWNQNLGRFLSELVVSSNKFQNLEKVVTFSMLS